MLGCGMGRAEREGGEVSVEIQREKYSLVCPGTHPFVRSESRFPLQSTQGTERAAWNHIRCWWPVETALLNS